MVGGDHQHVVRPQRGGDGWESAVDLLHRPRVAGGVAAVAVQHVGVDQVHEEQRGPEVAEQLLGLAQAVRVAFGVHRAGDSAAVIDVRDLAHPDDLHPRLRQKI